MGWRGTLHLEQDESQGHMVKGIHTGQGEELGTVMESETDGSNRNYVSLAMTFIYTNTYIKLYNRLCWNLLF